MSSIRHRVDTLEAFPSWFYVRLLLLTGFSWAQNAAEFVLFVMTRQPMAENTRLHTFAVEAMGGGVLIGAAVGGPLFGRIADLQGRRWALLLAKTLSLVGLMACALATRDYEVISARILAGIGIGGELPVAATVVHEMTPRSMRGRMIALLEAFTGVGGIVGVMLAFVLVPQFGWRITYLLLCSGIFYVGMLCFLLPEFPSWLARSGRIVEAGATVENLEHAHGTRLIYDISLMKKTRTTEAGEVEEAVETGKSSAFDKRVEAVMQWTLWIVMALSSNALGMYVPILISLTGYNMLSRWNTMMLLHMSQVLGSVLASLVLKEFGIKKVLVVSTSLAAIIAVILTYTPWYGSIVVMGTCTISLMLAASWSCVLVRVPTTFPVQVRGFGVGLAFGLGRLSSIGGSWLCPRMYNVWKLSVPAFAWVFASLLVIAVLVSTIPYRRQSIKTPSDHNTKSKTKLDCTLVVGHNSPIHKSQKNEMSTAHIHRRVDSLDVRLSWFYMVHSKF
ncbi:hypothetical protein PHMEG_0002600 [Phytophthora megakarya]|uniref:Major facilitator superfamily (MFS) profile domain-containing protein n=1 Tax=Phytophthora megakarya TaxID=4795 RepID=A0A225WYC4_9STRA|nr:hypothetical protein PHMEG_0002600 [Phytophthora megakarya]